NVLVSVKFTALWRSLVGLSFDLAFVSLTAMRSTYIISTIIEALPRKYCLGSIAAEGEPTMPMKNPPHPGGFVLRQCIEPLGLTITQAAAALGVTRTTLSELVNGKRGIPPEMAVRLSKVFGGRPESWLTQQAHYDLAHLRTTHIKLQRLQFA